jgi:two-component system NarL family sensor kinase
MSPARGVNNGRPLEDGGAAVALAFLRPMLLGVIVVSEKLLDARQLASAWFFVVLGLASLYALGGIIAAIGAADSRCSRAIARVQPGLDLILLSLLAYTSGGAFSDARKAFFVVPLAAAFSERPRTTAMWSLLAVATFSAQAVLAGGHPAGVLNTWQRVTLSQDLYLAWTGAAGTLLALALRRGSANTEELASSRQRLVTQAIESVERERTRLAGALHDSPVQNLIAARHDLRRAERSGDPESFKRLREALDDTITELREEIFNLHPHVLDHVGLSAALEQVARRHARDGAAQVTVDVHSLGSPANQQVLFALGRELLGNAAKHARASAIALSLDRDRGGIALEVRDNGRGIPKGRMQQALLDGHVGLAAVRERVEVLGGTLEITTADGAGTRVRAWLPEPVDSRRNAADVSDRVTALDTLRVSPT